MDAVAITLSQQHAGLIRPRLIGGVSTSLYE
jgi:hypothetical protein